MKTPEVDAGSNATVVDDQTYSLSGDVTQENEYDVEWTLEDGPNSASATINNEENEDTNVTVNEYGEYTFLLTATDEAGNENDDEVTITFEESEEDDSNGEDDSGGSGGQGGGSESGGSGTSGGTLPENANIVAGQATSGVVALANDDDESSEEKDDGEVLAEEDGEGGETTFGNDDTGEIESESTQAMAWFNCGG